jgi:hypothetical protein
MCSQLFCFVDSFDLVEVIGKQNRKVPILIPPETKIALEALVSTRGPVGIDASNPFMFPKVVINCLLLRNCELIFYCVFL